jgi:hypothetical protein
MIRIIDDFRGGKIWTADRFSRAAPTINKEKSNDGVNDINQRCGSSVSLVL